MAEAAVNVFHDPKTIVYDAADTEVACLGCISISVANSAVAQTSRSDGGTYCHFTTSGGVSGQLVFQDVIEAALLAKKTAAG